MPLLIDVDGHHTVGQQTHFESHSPDGKFAVVFQDDAETGYFYAIDPAAEGNKVQDGVHVYNVAGVADNEKFIHFHVGWSQDSRKSVLMINGVPQAVFDFDAKRGYCHSGYPEPRGDGDWGKHSHAWTEDTAKLFM